MPVVVLSLALAACSEQGIKALNSDPVAEITDPADGSAVTRDEEVSLRGVVSDPDADPSELWSTWRLDGAVVCEGAPAADGVASCEVVAVGDSMLVRLDVEDPQGAQASDAITLVVEDPVDPADSLAPTVDLVAPAWGTVVQVGEPVLFSAVADDPDGAEGALVWTWTSDLDGVFSTAPGDDAGHIDIVDAARSVGVHTITVEVADPDGLVARDVTALEVRAAPDGPSPPVVEIVPADPFT